MGMMSLSTRFGDLVNPAWLAHPIKAASKGNRKVKSEPVRELRSEPTSVREPRSEPTSELNGELKGELTAGPQEQEPEQRDVSRISDVGRTRGANLSESNALSVHGVAIIRSIAAEVALRVSRESRANAEDEFSRGQAPSVPLFDYYCRLARYVNIWRGHAGGAESAGVRAAVMALIYLVRLDDNHGFVLNWSNIHRLSMVAFLLSVKWSEDSFIGTDFWARVGGVPLSEVNALEARFCTLISFELFVSDKAYASMLDLHDPPDF
jgi:hypothetical protein